MFAPAFVKAANSQPVRPGDLQSLLPTHLLYLIAYAMAHTSLKKSYNGKPNPEIHRLSKSQIQMPTNFNYISPRLPGPLTQRQSPVTHISTDH